MFSYAKNKNKALGGLAVCSRLMIVALILGVIGGCGASSPYYANSGSPDDVFSTQAEPQFTMFFIGDTGSPAAYPPEPNLVTLQHHLDTAGENSAVVFLGDNIYSYGLLPQNHPNRVETERRMDAQIKIVEDYPGQAIFIPGNHDWNDDRPKGLEAIKRQQKYIENRLGDMGFMPDDGCPGPVEVRLDSVNTLLVLDTEWWLYPHEKPRLEQCANGSKEQFVQAVDSLVQQNKDRNLFVAGHHPIYTNGKHGGYFPATDHLFPLLDISPLLYIPLPIYGSINPLYRKYQGYLQDVASGPYSKLRNELIKTFKAHPRLVYAGGHDHSLQHHPIGKQHYIVSGAGTVENYVRKGKSAAFAYSHKGFARIDRYANEVVLSFWIPQRNQKMGRMVYQTVLFKN